MCEQSIRVELPALEASVAQELETLLAECPDVVIEAAADQEALDAIAAIDQKIDRLMSALAESSDLSMPYINRTIERLEEERQKLLNQQAAQYKRPRPNISRLRFSMLSFEQKKLVAAQFVKEIKLADDNAEVIWNV